VDTTNNVITAASLCSADTQAVLIDASGVPDCNAKRLNATLANGDLVRLAGLRLGVILRSRGGIEPQAAFRGLFDRTAVIGTDRRIRRTVFLYAGLPNALL
jgi:hypothetical protein